MQIDIDSIFAKKPGGSPLPLRPINPNKNTKSVQIYYWNKPYENSPHTVKELTNDHATLYLLASNALNLICSSFASACNQTTVLENPISLTHGDGTSSKEIYKFHHELLTHYLNDLANTLDLSKEESNELTYFFNSLSAFDEFVAKLEAGDPAVSEYMLRTNLVHFIDYFGRVNDWLCESGIYDRYEKAKAREKILERALSDEVVFVGTTDESSVVTTTEKATKNEKHEPFEDVSDGLKPAPVEEVRKLRVNDFSVDSEFVGKIDKDPNEGNGLYITNLCSPINKKGDQKYIDLSGEVVELKRFDDVSDLGERTSGQIDIEIPINTSSLTEDGYIVLPTHLGFRATAIGFVGKDGNPINGDDVVTEQNEFGVTILKNLNPNIKSVRYRLERFKTEAIESPPNEWKIAVETETQSNSFLDKSLEEARKEGSARKIADLTKVKAKLRHPVYSHDKNIQHMLKEAPDFYATQDKIGYIGHCEHMSLCRVNDLRAQGIPAIIAGGLVLGVNDGNNSFISNIGHAAVIYIDENGVPRFDEATELADETYKLDEGRVESDMPKVIRLYRLEDKEIRDKGLSTLASHWKKREVEPSFSSKPDEITRDHFPVGSTYEQGGTVLTESKEAEKEREERELSKERQNAYELASRVASEKENWESLIASGNTEELLTSVVAITYLVDSSDSKLHDFISNRLEHGELEHPIIELINSTNSNSYVDGFIEWCKGNIAKSKKETTQELVKAINQLYYRGERGIGVMRQLTDEGKIGEKLIPLIDISYVLDLNTKDLMEFRGYLRKCKFDLELVSTAQLAIEKELAKRRNSGEKDIGKIDISVEFKNALLKGNITSSKTIANYVEIMKLNGNPNLDSLLVDIVVEYASKHSTEDFTKLISLLYESVTLNEYFEKKDGKVILSPHLAKKVAERCKIGIKKHVKYTSDSYGRYGMRYGIRKEFLKSYYEEEIIDEYDFKKENIYSKLKQFGNENIDDGKYWWSLYCDIPSLLVSLESVGLDLRDILSKEDIVRIIRKDFMQGKRSFGGIYEEKDPILYTPSGAICLDRPSHLVQTRILASSISSQETSIRAGKNLAFLLDYFGMDASELDIERKSDEEIWEEVIKPQVQSYFDGFNVIPFLPQKEFDEVVSSNERNARLVSECGLTCVQSERTDILSSLFEKYEEASRLVVNNSKRYSSSIIVYLVRANVSLGTKYRYSILLDMLSDSKKLKELKAKLKEAFNDMDNPDFDKKLREIFKEVYSRTDNYFDINNELKALNEKELRIFAGILKEDGLTDRQIRNILTGSTKCLHRQERSQRVDLENKYELDEIKTNQISEFIRLFDNSDIVKQFADTVGTLPLGTSKDSRLKVLRNKIEYLTRLKNYPEFGVGLIASVMGENNGSFWYQLLCEEIASTSHTDELKLLSEGASVFKEASDLSNFSTVRLGGRQQSLFRNGNVQFITRSGVSRMYGISLKGDFHALREAMNGDPVKIINHKASARLDKLVVNESRDTSDPNPYHLVVDLEWLGQNMETGKLSKNVVKLITVLLDGMENRKQQHLHIFFRGNIVLSLTPKEIGQLLSGKVIEDDYGRRNSRTDFILQLNYLAKAASEAIGDREDKNEYDPSKTPVSNKEWIPPSREGTAIVITENFDTIKASMPLFMRWTKRHIDVRRLVV